MTNREITHSLVGIIRYDYFHPESESADMIYAFTHSQELNEICADMPPSHVVTPVDKETLKDALSDYIQRRNISAADAARIHTWLDNMPDEVAIIEREP